MVYFWTGGISEKGEIHERPDKYPEETDMAKKIIWVNETEYDGLLFDPIAEKPYLLTFINTRYSLSNDKNKQL
tara:strand:- start:382 stop:600 length:219 start_codon:yes stop_codon:yes gene_type:complete